MPLIAQHGEGMPARCRHCGVPAAGPCARCHEPVCGDCSVLTEGGANLYAICLGCARRSGRSLSGAWRTVLWWFAGPILALAAVLALLGYFGL